MEMRANEINPEPESLAEKELKAKFPFLGDEDDFSAKQRPTAEPGFQLDSEDMTAEPGASDRAGLTFSGNDTFDDEKLDEQNIDMGDPTALYAYFAKRPYFELPLPKNIEEYIATASPTELSAIRQQCTDDYEEFARAVQPLIPDHPDLQLPSVDDLIAMTDEQFEQQVRTMARTRFLGPTLSRFLGIGEAIRQLYPDKTTIESSLEAAAK